MPDTLEEIVACGLRDDGCGITINGRRAFCDDPAADPEIRREPRDCICRSDARIALAALEANGLVVVPREPTVAMLEARADILCGGHSPDQLWDAMIEARPHQGLSLVRESYTAEPPKEES